MHIRSKFDGGKVIHRSQSGSWEHRCAGLQQNYGRQWSPESWRKMTGVSPNKVFTDVTKEAAKKIELDRKRKAKDEVKAKRHKSKHAKREDNSIAARKAYSRHDGHIEPNENCPDISPEHLELLKNGFYTTKVTKLTVLSG